MTAPRRKKPEQTDVYALYREALGGPRLTRAQIDAMRTNVQRLARAVCEHVWGKRFY